MKCDPQQQQHNKNKKFVRMSELRMRLASLIAGLEALSRIVNNNHASFHRMYFQRILSFLDLP